MSNQWKALSLSFPVIGPHLAWHVDSETQVKIGLDVVMSCNRNILLLKDLVTLLRETSKKTLNLINKPKETSLWRQSWMSSSDVGLEGEFARIWELFVFELHTSHVKLCEMINSYGDSINKEVIIQLS